MVIFFSFYLKIPSSFLGMLTRWIGRLALDGADCNLPPSIKCTGSLIDLLKWELFLSWYIELLEIKALLRYYFAIGKGSSCHFNGQTCSISNSLLSLDLLQHDRWWGGKEKRLSSMFDLNLCCFPLCLNAGMCLVSSLFHW